jgi:hypothetical protein
LACGPRAGRARRGAAGLCKSPSSSRARGRPRQAGPACRWAAGEEAGTGWAGGRRWAGGRGLAREGGRKKKRRGWAGLESREKKGERKALYFF